MFVRLLSNVSVGGAVLILYICKFLSIVGRPMRIVIAGAGEIGRAIVRYLRDELDHAHITVIERNRELAEKFLDKFPHVDLIVGDVADPDTLDRAKLEFADVFIATTGSDTINIVSALLAKRKGVKSVIVKLSHPEYEELARALGINMIVSPYESTAIQIGMLLRSPGLTEIMQLIRRGMDIVEFVVKPGSKHDGASVEALANKDSHPLLIMRGNEMIFPKPGLRLRAGDTVILMKRRKRFKLF